MPLPLVPIAVYAASYGAVALTAWQVAKRIEPGRRDQRAEDALDELHEGVTLRHNDEGTAVTGRLRRTFRFGTTGPGLEVDAAGLGRVKFRKV